MKNRVTEERYGDVSRRVFLLLGSVLVLAGLVISNYSALIVRSHAAPLRSDSSGTSMIALSGDSVLQPSIELTSPAAAVGSTISVTTAAQGIADDGQCSLQEAIYSANFDFGVAPSSFNPIVTFDTGCEPGSGDDTIVLAAGQEYLMTEPLDDPYNPVGPTANPIVLSNMTIEANGSWLVRNNPFGDFTGPNFRAFAVARRTFADPSNDLGVQGAGIGNLTIRNAHIKGFTAKGGNGTDGGGGGLGAGGAIYVHDGRLLIDNSTFERNGAGGGNGSTRGRGYPGGGGGGIGGNGGSANYNNLVDIRAPGGGGGGARGDGADNGYYGDFHDGTKWVSAWLAWTHGGGGGGTLRNGGSGGYGQGRGFRCGGVGGDFQGDGGNGECPGGGGGGGGEPDVINVVDPDGDGGHGNYGGGGGGGGVRDSVALDGATGGRGGFGGGGGAGAREEYGFGNMESADGGRGGFGAGGGAGGGGGTGGVFGYFGGDGSGENGGGGAGLGGAIFSHKGTVRIRNSTFTGNYAVRGTAPDPLEDFGLAESGNDAGGAIFTLNGTLELFNSTIARNETTGDLGAVVVLSAYDQYFEIDPFNPVLPPNPPAALAVYNTIISNNGATSDGVVYTNTNGEVLATGLLITKAGSNNLILGNHANAAFRFPGVVSTSDPLLGPLQFNDPAGFTRTMALDPTSPAVNAGTDLMDEGITTDQRGVYRRPGAYDIGAYEVLDNTVPVAAAPSPAPSTNEDTAVAIGLSATDDDDDALTFTVTDGPDNGTLGVTTGSAVAADCTAANTCSLSVQYTPAANFNGSDSFKFKANDGLADSEEVTVAITVTPVNDAPVASATPLTQPNVQYSDPIQSVTITASDVETPAGSLTIAASYKKNGVSSVLGLPAGLAFTDNGVIGATRQWTVSGRANVPAGVYEISAAVTDRGDPDNVGTSPAISTSVSFTVNVIRENVVVTAANALSAVKVASPGGTSPQFELSASITEEDDGYPGDISKATPVTFMLTPIGGGSSPTCSNNTGSASGSTLSIECTFSSIPVGVYEVNIVVGGDYYTGGGSTVLTVYDPSLGFVSGGGWIINPDTGYRANYGVNVKYLKNGKAQGQVMYIEHRPTGDVKIKSNSMQNVAILTNEAQVTAKATYGDVGNYVVIARVIDNGEPGTNDKFGLKLLEPSGRAVADFNFLSSPVLIGGGNNQVPKKK